MVAVLAEAVGALQVISQHLHDLVPHLGDPVLGEHIRQRLVFLRLGHVGQREEVQELVGVGEVCALRVEVPAEGLHAGLVDVVLGKACTICRDPATRASIWRMGSAA